IVQIGRREPCSVERNQRTELRRNHGDDVQDHPLGPVARLTERVHDLQPLRVLELLLRRLLRAHPLAELDCELLHVDALQQLLDRLGAHLRPELRPVFVARLPVLLLVQQLVRLELGLPRIDYDVRLEVEDALEIPQRDVQQMADAARQALEDPDVAHGRGQGDVAEPLPPDLRLGHLDAALVADHAPVLHALVLPAEALPVGDRAEDLRAEQAVAFRLERAVVDRLRLRHLAVGPRQDLVRRRQADADGVEITGQRGPFVETGSHYVLSRRGPPPTRATPSRLPRWGPRLRCARTVVLTHIQNRTPRQCASRTGRRCGLHVPYTSSST